MLTPFAQGKTKIAEENQLIRVKYILAIVLAQANFYKLKSKHVMGRFEGICLVANRISWWGG